MPCSRQPLSTTTALSFSGATTRLIGKLPRSTASPAGSRRNPVGSGEVNGGLVWANADVHSNADSERASRYLRTENITGIPQRLLAFRLLTSAEDSRPYSNRAPHFEQYSAFVNHIPLCMVRPQAEQ